VSPVTVPDARADVTGVAGRPRERSRRRVATLAIPLAHSALAVLSPLAVLAGSAGTAVAQDRPQAGWAPATVPMEPIRIAPRTWYVRGDLGPVSHANQGFNANAGFVVTDEGVVVFDTLGTPALGAALLARIRKITPQPVRHVVISHYHADHFYGAQVFADAGAEIWAHRLGRDYLATDAPLARLAERRASLAPWVTERARLVPATRWIDAQTTFRLGGVTFRLMPAGPAHTVEDLMMWVEEEGVLFAGDLLFGGRIPFVGDADTRGWLAALDALVARAPRLMVGGHGDASDDAARDIVLTRDYLRYLREQMGQAVEELIGFEAAYARTNWSRFSGLPAFEAANRRNAYNVFLQREGEALGR
jgi:glyoxylase-like metal-dependent hydrolase (beta-lactamase superfamily II)